MILTDSCDQKGAKVVTTSEYRHYSGSHHRHCLTQVWTLIIQNREHARIGVLHQTQNEVEHAQDLPFWLSCLEYVSWYLSSDWSDANTWRSFTFMSSTTTTTFLMSENGPHCGWKKSCTDRQVAYLTKVAYLTNFNGFYDPRWCRISSIQCVSIYRNYGCS